MNVISRQQQMQSALQKTQFNLSVAAKAFLGIGVAIGIFGFIIGLALFPAIAWQGLLVNNLFFCGIAFAGLMFSVIFMVTDAYWGRSFKRYAEALTSFLPFGMLFFAVLFFGGSYIFEWYNQDLVIHSKEHWLNVDFFVWRQVLAWGVVLFFGFKYLKNALRPDFSLAASFGQAYPKSFLQGSTAFQEQKLETSTSYHKNRRLAPILGFLYAWLVSLVAFDWMMSIDQEWFSTMFGVQYLVANLASAGATLMLLIGLTRKKFGLEDYLSLNRYHDLSKLTFALCLLWTYMIFSQVLVIWYANLPEETPYVVLRLQSIEWSWIFWLIFAVMFLIPFFGLMSRTACRSIGFSRIIALDILAGVWLEKYFLIAPSMQENSVHNTDLNLWGFDFLSLFINLCIGVGMLSVFIACFFWFARRAPMLAISDSRLFADQH